MPAIATFGGASVRSFGRGIEQASAVLPANTVLFYNITNSTTQTLPNPTTQYSTTFDGNGDYLQLSSQGALALGAGDFTFEMWVYNNVASIPLETSLFDQRNNTNGLAVLQPYIDLTSTTGYGWYTAATYKITSGTAVVKLNQWQHLAICRVSGILRMYVDGVLVGSTVSDNTTYPTGSIRIGRSNDGSTTRYFTGSLSDLRVVVGTSLYTGNIFNVPQTPLTSVQGTQLLTCHASSIIDSSPNGFSITSVGNVTQVSSGPYNNWTVFSSANNKYFQGTATQADIGQYNASMAGTITVTGTTGAAGTHSGGPYFLTSPYNTTGAYSAYYGSAGSHTHALSTADVAGSLANTISITTITSTYKTSYIPAGCVIFRKTAPTSLNFTEFTPTVNGYFYGKSSAANTVSTDRTTELGASATEVVNGGLHNHSTFASYYYWGGGPYATYVYNSTGSHMDHAYSFCVQPRLKSKHLRAWTSTVDEPLEYGMIVMYTGSLTNLPAGWRICDGSLGTPDMVGYHIGCNPTLSHGAVWNSTNDVTIPSTQTGGTSTSNWSHHHIGAYTTLRGSNASHDILAVPHSHTFSVTSVSGACTPPFYKIAFIQYKGI